MRGFKKVSPEFVVNDKEVVLPLRGSKHSAGYDFVATEDLAIKPQESVTFATDVKAYMPDDEVLMMYVRSSMGIKKNLMMSNVTGIIDSDYYNNEKNDGNILICLRNMSAALYVDESNNIRNLVDENTVHIKKGERVAQGIFMEYKESSNCNSENERKGGVGSTDE